MDLFGVYPVSDSTLEEMYVNRGTSLRFPFKYVLNCFSRTPTKTVSIQAKSHMQLTRNKRHLTRNCSLRHFQAFIMRLSRAVMLCLNIHLYKYTHAYISIDK